MSEALNAVVAPDSYGSGATIEGVVIRRVVIDVANAAIYWQLKKASLGVGGVWEGTEFFMLPGSRQIVEPGITGVRIRAATPLASLPVGSNQAVVSVRAVT